MSLNKQTFYKSITLQPGEQFVIPANSELVCTSDPGSLTTTCATIPNCTLKCYRFTIATETDSDNLPVGQNLSLVAIWDGVTKIKDINYNFTANASSIELYDVLKSYTADIKGVINFYTHVRGDDGNAERFYFYFKSPDTIGANLMLQITGAFYDDSLYVKAKEVDCPTTPTP
jgi:hypothetical protein